MLKFGSYLAHAYLICTYLRILFGVCTGILRFRNFTK